MAVDYKPLNRQQDWNVQQKAALKKIFEAGESAATGGDSTLVSRKLIHLAMGGWFDGDTKHDIQALFKEIRDASDDADNARDLTAVVGAMRFGGNKKRVIRIMADAVVAQIV